MEDNDINPPHNAGNNGAVNQRGPLREIQNFDGHFYVRNQRRNGISYLICKYHRSRGCPGRGTIRRNGTFEISVDHTHMPNTRQEGEQSFRRELYQSAISQPLNARQIYNTIAPLHGSARIGIPFHSVQGAMAQWRHENTPRENPTNLSSFSAILNRETYRQMRTYIEGDLMYTSVTGQDFNTVTIADHTFLRSLVSESEDFLIHISPTAIPSSAWCKELISILCIKDDYVIPCAWALTSVNSIEAYTAILREIRRIAPQWNVNSLITSFGRNLHSSIMEIFPNANVYGSLFHYQEETQKLAMQHGVHNFVVEEGRNEIKTFLLSVFSLPLLPPQEIEEAFFELVRGLSENSSNILNAFVENYVGIWLRGVKPNNFSVYQNIQRLTDVFENYGNQLHVKIGILPLTWKFPEGMLSLQVRVFRDVVKINRGSRTGIQLRRLTNRIAASRIVTSWDDLQSNEINRTIFISRCSYRFAESRSEYLTVYLSGHDDQTPLLLIIGNDNVPAPVAYVDEQNPIAERNEEGIREEYQVGVVRDDRNDGEHRGNENQDANEEG